MRTLNFRLMPFALTLGAFAVALPGQTTAVFPAASTTVEGPSQFGPPFNGSVSSTSRYQQICATSVDAKTTGLIKQIAFRRANTLPSAGDYAAFSPIMDVSLSTSPRESAHMSNVFANNVGTDVKQFFTGSVNWPAAKKLTPGPSPFSYTIPGKASFLYVNTKGDLTIDIVRKSGFASPSLFFLDAYPSAISSKPPVVTTLGPGCAGVTGKNVNYPYSNWIPGAYGRSQLYYAANNSPVYWSIGLSNVVWSGVLLPFDLGIIGAKGCKLYHDNLILVPGLTSTRTTPYTSRWDLFFDIPNLPVLGGVTLYTQYILLGDTHIGNAAGLSVSDAKKVVSGHQVSGLPYFMETSGAPTSATGGLVQTTGFIVQFTY